MKRPVVLVVLLVSLISSEPAGADLVQTVPSITSGTGIGLVNTVLTVQNTPTESGCVAWNGTMDVVGPAACPSGIAGGDEKTGASQTLTRTLAELGIANAADLRIVLNAVQPGGAAITVDALVLLLYDAGSGAVLFTSSLAAPVSFADTHTGGGTSGFVFQMDAADAAAAQTHFADQDNRVGLAAALSNSAGGNETFYIVLEDTVVLCPEIAIAPASLPDGTVGVPYSQQLTATGGAVPHTFTVVDGTLPDGLTLAPDGLLSGVPSPVVDGPHTFTVRATDDNGCTRDRDYQVQIAAQVPLLPPGMLIVLALLLFVLGWFMLRRQQPSLST